jgi:release factor glutamine methyltransferase
VTEAPWTVLRALTWTRAFFEQRGVESARLEAEILLAHALKIARIQLYVQYDRPLDEQERTAFRDLVKRRATGEPVHYLTGSREFWSLELEVTPETLIPRPDTEVLVEEALSRLRAPDVPWGAAPRIADVGTGTGAIAIAIAHELKEARVIATDVSAPALAVAQRNAERHGVADRIHFTQGHLLRPAQGETLDAVLSNPPYIASEEILTLQREVRLFEPRRALDGGPDGDAAYRELVPAAAHLLRPSGLLVFEVGGAEQADRVLALIEQDGRYREPWTRRDYAGLVRVVGAARS